ncbi:hypothetical protein C9374_012092 [Naegleria lovaniensis]|uniref:Transmembrane protein n=1 Tax=Naegleria lovaniensis TaxID=51637 RepID=A0AA88G845_NAELO|nr:uncharacterized protein C9374_012092 [Naegleria lovaniensis]KAG2373485.1 hypothetical protein C9374_012092 [Naegleria lovaniensis]
MEPIFPSFSSLQQRVSSFRKFSIKLPNASKLNLSNSLSPLNVFRKQYNQMIKAAPLLRYLTPLAILSLVISYLSGLREYNRNVEMNIPYDVYKFSIKVTKRMVQELIHLKNQHANIDLSNLELISHLMVNCFDNDHSRLMCQFMLNKYGNEIIKEVLNVSNKDQGQTARVSDEIFSNLFSKIDYSNAADEYFHQFVEQTPLTSSYLSHDWRYRLYRTLHKESSGDSLR